MCRIQMPTETNDFAHQDSTHKLGKNGQTELQTRRFLLGFCLFRGVQDVKGRSDSQLHEVLLVPGSPEFACPTLHKF